MQNNSQIDTKKLFDFVDTLVTETEINKITWTCDKTASKYTCIVNDKESLSVEIDNKQSDQISLILNQYGAAYNLCLRVTSKTDERHYASKLSSLLSAIEERIPTPSKFIEDYLKKQ